MKKEQKETLLSWFPTQEKIDNEVIKKMLDELEFNCGHYQDIYDYFRKYIDECLPGSDFRTFRNGTPEREEYFNYVHGDENKFYNWVTMVENAFLVEKGQRRTLDEACKLAAEKWCDKLFEFHLQDNGAMNENHGGGFYACALGTLLKEDSRNNITNEMIEKTYQNLYDYYKGGCIYHDEERDYTFKVDLYCDYYPNAPLEEILEKSGIPERERRNICPWKSGIQIDYKDNAVIMIGYQKRDYI